MRIYLDHNATVPMDPRVLEAMLPWLRGRFGNPSSLHAEGRAARRAVEDARDRVAELLDARPGTVVFTSGATEANATALRGLVAAAGRADAARLPRLAVSAVEHPSVLGTAERLAAEGVPVVCLPVDGSGRLDLDALDGELDRGVDVLAVMAANNEVGTLQPWEEVAARCRARGVALHTDAVQVVGKTALRVPDPGRGTLSLSGHKFGGPKGVGVLWVREDTRVLPLLEGGGQERQRRAGTENVAGIVGLGEACRLVIEEAAERTAALRRAEETFLAALRSHVPDLVVHGPADPQARLPGTLNLRVPGVAGETLLVASDLEGVAFSLGSACSSGAVEPSHVLDAMAIDRLENLESFRVSLGWAHPDGELETAARRIGAVVGRNRRSRGDFGG